MTISRAGGCDVAMRRDLPPPSSPSPFQGEGMLMLATLALRKNPASPEACPELGRGIEGLTTNGRIQRSLGEKVGEPAYYE